MIPINGTNVIAYLTIDDELVPIFCATDCTFSEEKDVKGAATLTSGEWRESRLRRRSWKFDISGIIKINNDDGQVSYFFLILDSNAMSPWALTISFTDPDGNTVSISGTVYIQQSSITGPASDFANASATFIGTGAYVLSLDSSSSGGGGGCTPVTYTPFTPPNGQVGEAYSYTIPLLGDGPFTLLGFPTAPSGMTVVIDGDSAVISGTPDTLAVGAQILFTVQNCDGANSTVINKTIDIVSQNPSDTGQYVFVVNSSDFDIVIENDNSASYSYPAHTNGSFRMPTANVNIISGTPLEQVDMGFYTSLPTGIIGSIVPVSNGNTYATSDLSLTNYIQFTTD